MAGRASITAEIVPIGNSRGVRIPKSMREEVGLEGQVTLRVAGGALVIRPKRAPRADWRARFARAGKPRRAELLVPDEIGTEFDSEWTW